jgi:hypothetical protein
MSDSTARPMTNKDRDQLIRLARMRAKQAIREAEAREKILLAEVTDQLTVEFEAHDRLWADAVIIAEAAAAKANSHIRAVCADLGIPAKDAPALELGWHSRSSANSDPRRRAELRKLAEARLTALTKTTKAAIGDKLLEVETELIAGSFETSKAKTFLAMMPTAEGLMPPLSIEDLGVKRWQPTDDTATKLTTPLTPADRQRRQILRLIEGNPAASDHEIAQIAGLGDQTVAVHRSGRVGNSPELVANSPEPGA